jgi:hypothetical protein
VRVRLLGILLILLGGSGTAYATWAIYAKPRPRDVGFGLLAPVAVLSLLLGLLLIFVPGFLDAS